MRLVATVLFLTHIGAALTGLFICGLITKCPEPFTVEYTNCYMEEGEMAGVHDVLKSLTNVNVAPPLPVRKP